MLYRIFIMFNTCCICIEDKLQRLDLYIEQVVNNYLLSDNASYCCKCCKCCCQYCKSNKHFKQNDHNHQDDKIIKIIKKKYQNQK